MKKTTFIIIVLGLLGILCLLVLSSGCGVKEGRFSGVVTLRSKYLALKESEVDTMLKKYGFFDSRKNKRQDFPNQFELIEQKKEAQFKRNANSTVESIVRDKTTGLVWLQSGSNDPMPMGEAIRWRDELNKMGYGGYNTWRIPTLEEAASLIESRMVKKRHIDPIFSSLQYSIYTGDRYFDYQKNYFWGISFASGRIIKMTITEPNYLRLVTEYASK